MTAHAQTLFNDLVRSGADALEFENCSDGMYDIFLNSGSTGIGITRIGGSEGIRLAERMRAMRSVTVDGAVYRIRSERWESFGEYNYRYSVSAATSAPKPGAKSAPKRQRPRL